MFGAGLAPFQGAAEFWGGSPEVSTALRPPATLCQPFGLRISNRRFDREQPGAERVRERYPWKTPPRLFFPPRRGGRLGPLNRGINTINQIGLNVRGRSGTPPGCG